ncbi:uncharacterized protein LOC113863885 [Abrus precatorius]|uniref:Uncharacterized protein LOC113863885 n=1 Tax=Abrus precatorius TaxID=3816 RepID=A0A8B8LB43_ABRPR|nr:uncharacterized protein LOC113863885 [Abrus precatorius]
MAAATTPSEDQVPLKLFMCKEKNKVFFAEAGKDFVDALFSFLTLPLGTIARIVSKESNIEPIKVGCLSSLYESVANLDKECMWTEACKEMLMKPRNSMEAYCKNQKLNIDDTDPTEFFICKDFGCSRKHGGPLSTFLNVRCSCGKLMCRKVSSKNLTIRNGFVSEVASFIVSDDLCVMPNEITASVSILQNHGIENVDVIEEQIVNISKKEVVDLLKCSLLSKTPLTDLFLKKKQLLDDFDPSYHPQFEVAEVKNDGARKIVLKVLVRKSNGKILFTQAEEDFADFLFSFLTFPLGGVLHMLEGYSSLCCIDNLYKSISNLSLDRYLISRDLKDELANPLCAPQFNLRNQILPIGAAGAPTYWFTSYYVNGAECGSLDDVAIHPDAKNFSKVYLYLVDPKSSTGETSSSRGFVKGPSTYIVTDDLVVTPMSTISSVSLLNRSKVPLSDLEERIICIGLKEGLSMLKAALTSTRALSNSLNQLIKPTKEEN